MCFNKIVNSPLKSSNVVTDPRRMSLILDQTLRPNAWFFCTLRGAK